MSGLQNKMALPTNISDSELLEQMIKGDEEAFISLYRRRQSGVYRFALQMSGSGSIAEDVTQEVFMTLIGEAENYDATRGSLQAFLYGIARNFVLRKIEKENRFVTLTEDSNDTAFQASETFIAVSDPLGDLTRSETIESVRQAVLALPARYREVVVLCDLHEMSYAEAATALQCAVGTVRSRLHRARCLLAERLRRPKEEENASKIVSSRRSFVV
jgi:RNA polymerase sigma-70 factor (ECF subfamily)